VQVRVSRASSVIVHRVPPDGAEPFLEWQRGVAAATAEFPGYQATDIYPPGEGQPEWVVVLHFDQPDALQRWLASPLRAEWLAKLRGISGEFEVKTLPGGFGAWFTGLSGQPARPLPPPWKMVLSVLLGLYPTVMLLAIFVGPHTNRFGLAAGMLISNALRAIGPRGKAVTVGGLLAVLLTLVGLMLLFRAVID
jgi:antibiotic biosynthesis monooxygenase (ABM) superfamily enzyme